MAERKTPILGRKNFSKSVLSNPGSPDPESRATSSINRNDCEAGPSSSCSSPLLPRQRGRFSFYSQSSESSTKSKKKGFLKIFKWFRKRGKSKDSAENSSACTSVSVSGSNNSLHDQKFVPLSRSKSADNHKNISKSFNRSNTARSSQLHNMRSNSSNSLAENNRRLVTYTNIDEMKTEIQNLLCEGQLKRVAPQPPSFTKCGEVKLRCASGASNNSTKRFSNGDSKNPFNYNHRRSKGDSTNPFLTNIPRNSIESTNSFEGRISRGSNNSSIYSRSKRKAPQPPTIKWTSKVQQLSQSIEVSDDANSEIAAGFSENTGSPAMSTLAIDTGNPSQASTLQSLSSQSNSTLRGSISSKCSVESLRLEKGYLKQDLPSSPQTVTKNEACSNSPQPRPWYKRKKKTNSSKKKDKLEPVDQVYEFWRPEIQFSEGKITVSNKGPECSPSQSGKSSIKKRVVEACKPKRKSQISLLASISQLDQEAVEQLRKEKEDVKAAKDAYDEKFYKKSSPLILTQTDLSGTGVTNSLNACKNRSSGETMDGINDYDNTVLYVPSSDDNRLSYTQQSTLKLKDTENGIKESDDLNSCMTNDNILKKNNLLSWPIRQFSTSTVSVSQITSNSSIPTSPASSMNLLQMANMDAELFYQLAKDVKRSPDNISKQLKSDFCIASRKSNASSQESDSDQDSTLKLPRQTKNFGMRMNHIFTPDVSVIMEASESITSSATTPAEETFSELSSLLTRENNEIIYQDLSVGSELHSEYRFNTVEAEEIMQELTDVRHEIDRINEEEYEDQLNKEIDKVEKIRQEVRMLREKDNFSVWQDMVSGASSRKDNCAGVPPPIDIVAAKAESKWKWACEVCTLINLPWRITCEACSARRPTNPTRIREDGSRISPIKSPSEHSDSSQHSNSDGSPLTVIHGNVDSDEFRTDPASDIHDESNQYQHRRPNWESELKKYFNSNGGHQIDVNNDKETQRSLILYNKVTEESAYGKICVSRSISQGAIPKTNHEPGISKNSRPTTDKEVRNGEKPSLEELRKARVERFEQGIKTFEALLRGPPDSNSISGCSNVKREVAERTTTGRIDVILPEFNSSDKVFYKKEARKRQVLNTRGAVKSTISIFNQKEQFDKAKKNNVEFNKPTRRKSFGLIKDQTTIFEKMQVESSIDANRSKSYAKEFPRPKELSKTPEIDISSAISKFDEMAALAEVERLNSKPIRPKLWKKAAKLSIGRSHSLDQDSAMASLNNSNINDGIEVLSESADKKSDLHIDKHLNHSRELKKTEFEPEPMILDGVLYTSTPNEGMRGSMSIGSSTFELIHATEFEEFEAENSHRCSPTSVYEDAQHLGDDSDDTENFVDAADQNSSLYGHYEYIPDKDNNGYSNKRLSMTSNIEDENEVDYDFSSAVQVQSDESYQNLAEVETLSHQLTLTKGIANFKASLGADNMKLTPRNSVSISLLLKKLEVAIARGDHGEAALLARELATLKVTCSVAQKDDSGDNNTERNGRVMKDRDTSYDGDSTCKDERNVANKGTSDGRNKLETAEQELGSLSEEVVSPDQIPKARVPPIINIQVTKELHNNTTVHLAVEPNDPNDDLFNDRDIHMRQSKPMLNRREVKSDNISRLTESPVSSSGMPSIIENFNVQMYVEDRSSHQGPLDVNVNASMTVGELRSKVYEEFGFPPEVQRWILGRRLADDDHQTLAQHRVTTEGCPVFLYLVAPRPNSRYSSNQFNNKITGLVRNNEDLSSLKLNENLAALSSRPGNGVVDDTTRNARLESPTVLMARNQAKLVKQANNTGINVLNKQSIIARVEDQVKGSELVIMQKEEEKMKNIEQFPKIIQTNITAQTINALPPITDNPVSRQGSSGAQSTTTGEKSSTPQINRIHVPQTSLQSKLEPASALKKNPQQLVTHPIQDNKLSALNVKDAKEPLSNRQLHSPLHKESLLRKSHQPQPQQGNETPNKKPPPQKFFSGLTTSAAASKPMSPHLGKRKQEEQELGVQQQHTQVVQELNMIQQQHMKEKQQQHQHEIQQQAQRQQSAPQERFNQSPQLPRRQPLQKDNTETLRQPVTATCKSQAHSNIRALPSTKSTATSVSSHTSSPSTNPLVVQRIPEVHLVTQKANPATQTASSGIGFSMKSSGPDTTTVQTITPAAPPRTFILSPAPSASPPLQGWVCPRCTLVNHLLRPGCEACATEKPGDVENEALQQPTQSDDVVIHQRAGAVSSAETFECRVCLTEVPAGVGVVLRDCLHSFCRECLANAVRYSDTAEVKCPYRDERYACDAALSEREVKALVSEAEYERHLNKSVKQAAGSMQNVFYCKTPDCRGFCVFEDNVNVFLCSVCYKQNCLTCQAQHAGQSCRQYQEMAAKLQDMASVKTQKFFEDMIRRGDGLPCPHCSVMLVRKWGCDWMRCPMCRTEICWVTKGPRWGPKGQGDTSGGCQCGVKGRKCHPKCTYCH